MANTEEIELNCILYGSNPAKFFRVDAPIIRGDASGLKSLVCEAARVRLGMVIEPQHLTLWKPNQPLIVKPIASLAQRLEEQGSLSQVSVKLTNPTDEFAVLFPETPVKGNVHIIVVVSDVWGSSTKLTDRTPPSTPSFIDRRNRPPHYPIGLPLYDHWFFELHSKIWGRDDLQSKLFCEVEVTLAHYNELQKRLTELNPNRNSPEYNSTNIRIGSVQLEILRHFKPPPSDETIGEEKMEADGNDDGIDDELRSLFPVTIRYLDLSCLELTNPPKRLPLPMLIREEYDDITKLLEGRPKSQKGSVVLSGQPGIGGTAYLHLRMIEYMLARRPFVYQTPHAEVYEVSDVCVPLRNRWPSQGPITTFFDMDFDTFELNPFLCHSSIRLIAASSLRGCERLCESEYLPEELILPLAQALWTPSELFITGLFLHPYDTTFTRLQEAAAYFGYNPQLCFLSSRSSAKMLCNKNIAMQNIHTLAATKNLRWTLHGVYESRGPCHSVFALSPTHSERMLYLSQIGAVSAWALDLLLQQYEARDANAAEVFYESIVRVPEMGLLRKHLMEIRELKATKSLTAPHG